MHKFFQRKYLDLTLVPVVALSCQLASFAQTPQHQHDHRYPLLAQSAAPAQSSTATDATPSAAVETGKTGDRPINFIFLIDVSGSMVTKRTMVTGAGGKQITLFEALRDALRAIVNDPRVVPPNSKVSFITFGTAIESKSDWPASVATADDRTQLVSHISSATELQADKHGDTYMAGALDSAYQKIEELTVGADPCATTFVVMMTDGWDEPPPGAKVKVRDIARTFVQKQHALVEKLGVNTLQVRVIGLQRLPDSKAGTTTAKELATILGGDFLDVTTQGGSTVASRIFSAVQKTISDLRAKIDVADARSGGLADFGEIKSAQANASIKVASRSCYPEQITGMSDETAHLTPDVRAKITSTVRATAKQLSGALSPASSLPAGMLKVHLQDEQYTLAPAFKQKNNLAGWQSIVMLAEVDRECQPGNYYGAVRLTSTALMPELVAYCVTVPSRILFEEKQKQATVRKPGFFFAKETSTALPVSLSARVGKKLAGDTRVVITPQEAQFVYPDKSGSPSPAPTIAAAQINDGKPFEVVLPAGESAKVISIPVFIPAEQHPGKYTGFLKVRIDGDASMKSVDQIPFTVLVQPSAWEEIAPVAIPVIALLALMLTVGFILTVSRLRR